MPKLAQFKTTTKDVRLALKEGEAFIHGKVPKGMKVIRVPKPASPAEAKAARRATHLSQSEFAAALGISLYTVRSWEQGRRKPGSVETKILRIAAKQPQLVEVLAAG